MNYTITLTDAQVKAVRVDMVDIQDWLENAITVRAELAQNKIIEKLVAHCNENEIALAVGTSAQVDQAYELGLVSEASAEEVTP